MKNSSRFQIKVINFWKKNKNKIIVGIIIWLIIILINTIIKNKQQQLPAPSTTYTPHISVMNENEQVPEKYQEKIVNLVDTYFNYCNNGEYEKAYNLITEDCKKNNYPTLEDFKGYLNIVFQGKKKIYNIQSYSIVDNIYIYSIRILDDILATGTTDGYYYYEEKIVLIEENGEMKLSIAEFIKEEEPNIIVEDDNMIIKVLKKVVDYETEEYTVQITNKTDNYIVISDSKANNEVKLGVGGEERNTQDELNKFIIEPNSSKIQSFKFTKFFDDGYVSNKLVLGAIRILKEYDENVGTTEEVLNSAVKLYSLEIEL